jgi:hypothetical protein
MDWNTKLTIVIASATLLTSGATLAYVVYSFRALRALRAQTNALVGTLEVTWLGMRFDAVEKQIRLLDDLRSDRHVVYELSDDWKTWNEEQKKSVERVIRAFDVYGFMDRNQFVPRALLHQFYAYPVTRIWSVAQKYIDFIRSPKGRNQPGHMWELEQLKERAKAGPKHPAESGQKDWPPETDDVVVRRLKQLQEFL